MMSSPPKSDPDDSSKMTDTDWKNKLTPDQYYVLREQGTEAPFTCQLLNETGTGNFTCAACGSVLFISDHKYESDIPSLAGWPSFADVARGDAVELTDDNSLGMRRTEVTCKTCGGHLGHLFPDDTSPTGQHYCINSVALDFQPKK